MIANPTLMIERERRRPIPSKQATLDLFQTLAGELPPLQHDLLERQSFSLANAKNVTPFVYHARDTQLQVYAVPEDGMATIGASDVLIWTAGHSLAAQDYRPSTTRSFGFTPYKTPSRHLPCNRRSRVSSSQRRADTPKVDPHPDHRPLRCASALPAVLLD